MKCLVSDVTVQAVTELDNKAAIAIRQSFNGIVQCVARIVVRRPLRLLPEYRPYRYHTAGTIIVVLLTTVSVSVYILCSWWITVHVSPELTVYRVY